MASDITFFLGTTNGYKVSEIASILRPLEIPLRVTDPIDPEETGVTFEENALIKATAYSAHVRQTEVARLVAERGCSVADAETYLRMSRVWTICEDSGLVVPALGGLPGPWSARFADCELADGKVVAHRHSARCREEIDLANNSLVLDLLRGVPQPLRAASFVVAFVVADIDGQALFRCTSEIAGWIVEEPRGEAGFGYDPIFASGKSFGKTYAEIDSMRKNLISHRRKALQDFTCWLARQIR